MRTLTASVAFALTLGLYGLTPAMAASFNEKSIVELDLSRSAARAEERATDRSMELASPSSSSPTGRYCEIIVAQGFNEREEAKQIC